MTGKIPLKDSVNGVATSDECNKHFLVVTCEKSLVQYLVYQVKRIAKIIK
jgi:hypothetical protein